jgi:phosphoribosylanthranilate isomerase
VVAALGTLQPFGVDVSSGVEYPAGGKDPRLIRAFLEAVKQHDNARISE